jgi:hypothetical protein
LIVGVAFKGVGELQGRQHKSSSPPEIMTLCIIFCNHLDLRMVGLAEGWDGSSGDDG